MVYSMRSRGRCRPLSGRVLVVVLAVVGFCAYCYYYTTPGSSSTSTSLYVRTGPEPELGPVDVVIIDRRVNNVDMKPHTTQLHQTVQKSKVLVDECETVRTSRADIDTLTVYPSFDFQPSWMRTKEFWDKSFEDRYERTRNDSSRPPLKVIVVPHSHNDPGWLKTFEQYFEWRSKKIINNIVEKLTQYRNMTFIWTEISFLNSWWERSHPVKQKALKKLIKDGRLEITTGGWVMPDEACTHIYSLIDQFIEGHSWVKRNLGVNVKSGWSIDPFGHGPTVPYILDKSGLRGTVIQRIHYAWKQWLAQQQIEEFIWIPGWRTDRPKLVVHNQPFDIYSIKSSCGPHPSVCLGYDFRKIPGEYNEYTDKFEEITDFNLEKKSKILIEEYVRIGSLTPHNVVLVPLGDDFRYDYSSEFDSQYINYMKMFNYINLNKDKFNADVVFGTPFDYFNAVQERHENVPSLKGDFFVYSDIFTEGKPAYWSGYYTTRPYHKLLARQLEHQLRTSEILFTLVWNYLKQMNDPRIEGSEKLIERSYEQLINARRNLGLFQHHDAITGTSRSSVMYDYGLKLYNNIYSCIRLQEAALTSIMLPDERLHLRNVLQSELVWDSYGKAPKKLQVSYVDKNIVIIFNPLAESRREIVILRSNTTNIRVYDTRLKVHVPYQITPNIEIRDDNRPFISDINFDLLFEATLPPLTSVTFNLEEHTNSSNHCVIFCNNCSDPLKPELSKLFPTKRMMPGDIQLENSFMKLLINRNTGFLRQIYRKDLKKRNVLEMQFGAYQSAQRHSGAYLFMPDYDSPEKPVLNTYSNINDENIIIVSGPVSTEITTMYLPFLIHTIRIYNLDDVTLSRAIFVENIVDFESPPKNRDTELFMRIQTDIQNGEIPEFYTDQNGFQYQKRVKIEKLGIQANYYPITTMAWLQDEETRLTLVTNHAQGASAFEPGRLEVMLDRRTLYDDFRGIGEGVLDNRPTTFHNWILLEDISTSERHSESQPESDIYQLPSQNADYLSRALNYPVNVYLVDTSEVGQVQVASDHKFVEQFPTGVHLLTLRTITDPVLEQYPSTSSYMVLQRSGYSCTVGTSVGKSTSTSTSSSTITFNKVHVTNITHVSLTGLHTYGTLTGLHDVRLKPMEVNTYQIWF